MQYDVAVVGAGPAGTASARAIATEGFKVLLLEEHPKVGQPVHCSGLVTARTLEAAGIEDGIVLNRIRGAIVHTPSGKEILVGNHQVRALVIDRQRFDEILAERAQEAGVDLLLNARIVGKDSLEQGARLYVDHSGKRLSIDTKLLIGADGSRSHVARFLGLPSPQETILATGGEVKVKSMHPDYVEVFVGPQIAPGWFGWLIPVEGQVARIGVGTSDHRLGPRSLLNNMVSQFPRFEGAQFLRLQGGAIPITPLRKVFGQHTLLVGDAAGQVKPTSGGGIYMSLLGAQLCAETALEALRQEQLGERQLSIYQKRWMERLGQELGRGSLLRQMLAALKPQEVEAFLLLLARDDIQRTVRLEGDIDFPARLFTRLFSPGMVLRGLRSLPPAFWPRLLWMVFRWHQANGHLGRNGNTPT